jgi:hypothetical protein
MKSLITLVHEVHSEFKRLRAADPTLQLGTDPKLLTVGDITICKIGGTVTQVRNDRGVKKPLFPSAADIVGLFLNSSIVGPYPHEKQLVCPTLFVDSYKFLTGFKPEEYCRYVVK